MHAVFGPIQKDVTALLEHFDTDQLTAIAEFLSESTNLVYRHAALLRAEAQRAAPESARAPHHRGHHD